MTQVTYEAYTNKIQLVRRKSTEVNEVKKQNVLLGEIESIQAENTGDISVGSSNIKELGARERLEYVRELSKDLDLTTPEGEREARRLLAGYDLPQHKIYGLQPPPITDEIRQRVKLLAEQRASGDVS